MATVVWTEPALNKLDEIADYIAFDDFQAARRFVQKVFEKADLLYRFEKVLSLWQGSFEDSCKAPLLNWVETLLKSGNAAGTLKWAVPQGCVKKTRFAALPEWSSMDMQPHSGAWHFLTFFIAP